jgi:hypothetical protein
VRALTDQDVSQYEREGLIGPFPLVGERERRELIRHARIADRHASWYRGLLAFDSSVARIGGLVTALDEVAHDTYRRIKYR